MIAYTFGVLASFALFQHFERRKFRRAVARRLGVS
jgi:hypothetical protein